MSRLTREQFLAAESLLDMPSDPTDRDREIWLSRRADGLWAVTVLDDGGGQYLGEHASKSDAVAAAMSRYRG